MTEAQTKFIGYFIGFSAIIFAISALSYKAYTGDILISQRKHQFEQEKIEMKKNYDKMKSFTEPYIGYERQNVKKIAYLSMNGDLSCDEFGCYGGNSVGWYESFYDLDIYDAMSVYPCDERIVCIEEVYNTCFRDTLYTMPECIRFAIVDAELKQQKYLPPKN